MVHEARTRVLGLSKEAATCVEAATVFGRMYLCGVVTKLQYDAGIEFFAARKAYLRAIQARGMASGGDMERQRGHDGSDGTDPAYVEACEAAERIYLRMRDKIVTDAGLLGFAVIEAIVCDDVAMPDFEGDLRMALNALCRRAETRRAA